MMLTSKALRQLELESNAVRTAWWQWATDFPDSVNADLAPWQQQAHPLRNADHCAVWRSGSSGGGSGGNGGGNGNASSSSALMCSPDPVWVPAPLPPPPPLADAATSAITHIGGVAPSIWGGELP
eukprot:TRINITY_DN3164_c1_g1_i8.p2 TRINITY_DN3164_c1_g1~~TRINITY_DN3164_c1_g1_i8.p2  ORF type:complete len:125 (-),score=31.40 TRINITY_DN3164_c1_g1_i8:338-712(-)